MSATAPLLRALGAVLIGFAWGCARPAAPTDAEILWDTWGVPHVRADDELALFRAFGWAQMDAHAELLLQLIGEARGRAAEYWGADFLDGDRWVHTNDIPRRASDWYAAQSPTFARRLDAFAAGVNAYGRAHGDTIGAAQRQVLPVEGVDLLAHLQRLLHFSFVADASLVAGASPGGAAGGSNAWAVAPARSASGRALLLTNPHLPWQGRFRLFEAHLECPGYRAYGATFVGFPVLATAFNDALGWTHTVNAQDGADLFRLETDGDSYAFGSERRPIAERSTTIRVRSADGSVADQALAVRASVHGPLVDEGPASALALRVVGLDRPGAFEQWWEMGRARDLEAFERALRRQQLPLFSALYADRVGNVLHHFGGLTPRRDLAGLDWSAPVDGSDAETLWTEYLAYDELPRVQNPPSGWLQNANDPPWTTTLPATLDPADFPPYLAPRGMSLRAQQSAQLLAADGSISLDELVAYKHSTEVELAQRVLPELLPLASTAPDPDVREAGAVLAAWDRRVAADSRGALLFLLMVQAIGEGPEVFREAWDPDRPTATPDGVADPALLLEALSVAAAQLAAGGRDLGTPWGEVFRLRGGSHDHPCSGGMGQLGIFRCFDFAPDVDGAMRAVGGETYVAAVEFTDPPRARVLNTYGNASRPGSPHDGDQLALAAAQSLREAWFDWARVESNTLRRAWVPPE